MTGRNIIPKWEFVWSHLLEPRHARHQAHAQVKPADRRCDARGADEVPKRRNGMPHFSLSKKLPHDNGSIPHICPTAVGPPS